MGVGTVFLGPSDGLNAQVTVEPFVLARVLSLVQCDLPAAELPEFAPVEGLAAMRVALFEAMKDGAITPGEPAAREWRALFLNWLGAYSPTLNPFYNLESLPGWAARELIARLEEIYPALNPPSPEGDPATPGGPG